MDFEKRAQKTNKQTTNKKKSLNRCAIARRGPLAMLLMHKMILSNACDCKSHNINWKPCATIA
jgi:hypothetical protein